MAETPTIEATPSSGIKPGEKSAPSLEQMKSLAAQFESVLLGQMMQQMRASMFDTGADGDDKESGGFSVGPLADQVYAELSLALSRAGGVGLSEALGGALTRQAGSGVDPGVDSSLPRPFDPGVETVLGSGGASGLLAAGGEASGLLGPTGKVSSQFGWRRDPIDGANKFHKGMDIAMPVGHDVVAADAGRVESVGDVPGYGLMVTVKHAGGLTTKYAHLSEATVKVGDAVGKGQVIAKSGNSGRSTGPHLHFEVIKEDEPIDPAGVIGR